MFKSLVPCLCLLACGCISEISRPEEVGAEADGSAAVGQTDGAPATGADARTNANRDAAPTGSADAAPTICGDGRCSGGETAQSCDQDCGACRDLPPGLTALEQTLIDMPADSWYELPNSAMRAVCVPDSVGVRGTGGCPQVVRAWSGGTFDSARSRLILWGGGHNDYYGNELYAFDIAAGSWSRLTEPSTGGITNRDPVADGNPVSRHTYDSFEYLAGLDRLFGHGGSRASDGGGTGVTWTFDMANQRWENRAPSGQRPGGGVANASAYDPNSQTLLYRTNQDLYSYSFQSNAWTHLKNFGNAPDWPRYEAWGDKTGAVDPTRGLYWDVGSHYILIWDIAQRRLVTDSWVTTGAGSYSNADVVGRGAGLFESGGAAIYDARGPGLDYDLAADALVAWSNGGGPYALDLTTKVWTRGTGAGAPTSNTSGGTYGRWRYVPAYNVFILVTSVDTNVHFYKHTRCAGQP